MCTEEYKNMKRVQFLTFLASLSMVAACGQAKTSASEQGSLFPSESDSPSLSEPSSVSPSSSASETSKTIEQVFSDVASATGLTLTGTGTRTYSDGSKETDNRVVKFSPSSYSLKATGPNPLEYAAYDDNGKAVNYSIDTDNKVVKKDVTLSSDGTTAEFSFFSNPFSAYKATSFTKEGEDSLSFNLSDKTTLSALAHTASLTTLYNLTDFASASFTLSDGLLSFDLVTNKVAIDWRDRTISYHFSIDISPLTDHTTAIPTPLKHYDYHDTLSNAFKVLENGKYKVSYQYHINGRNYDYIGDYYQSDNVKRKKTSSTEEGEVYSADGYYLKDGKYYDIKKLPKQDKYYYSREEAAYPNPTEIKFAIAPEFFIKDENDYVIENLNANTVFAENITPFLIASSSVTKTTVSLNSNSQVSVIKFSGSGISITFTYDYSKEAYSQYDNIQQRSKREIFNGTYTFEATPGTTTTIVANNGKATLNGGKEVDATINAYGNFSFTSDGHTWEINYSSYTDGFRIYYDDKDLTDVVTFTPLSK